MSSFHFVYVSGIQEFEPTTLGPNQVLYQAELIPV